MRVYPHKIYLWALEGKTHMYGRRLPARAEAAKQLKQMYGQDFGDDAEKWRQWLRYNWRKYPRDARPPAQKARQPRPKEAPSHTYQE